jgi:tetratricopeptide (TPR) repeat protein
MAKKTANIQTPVEANVGEILSKSERFIELYRNHIIIAVSAVILIIAAVIGIRHYYFLPIEREAEIAIFPGESYLANQQWDLALNGNGADYFGFIDIIDNYGHTRTARLARAYAGICYYHLDEPEEALSYLTKYKTNDKVLRPVINGLIGDCYVNLNKIEEGIKYFNRAASEADSEDISPIYLKKAATAYEAISDYANAIKTYQTIRNRYPNSLEASDIEKYIERASLQIR